MKNIFFIAAVIALFSACTAAPDFSLVPEINFISMSRNTMKQSKFPTDSIRVVFGFKDGDGDINIKDTANVFIFDKRQNALQEQYVVPMIPKIGSNKGVSGEITVTIHTTCCLPPNGKPCEKLSDFPKDSLVYQIYMKDKAGNKSNVIETKPIFIECK
jgi:hypothetical protein